mmetsp:Transcript_19139/g.57474  ORF Transcript_19139/g.57474 Transcript_19139/m.57474 type:complete len:242 (+) Transcript_19139:120-845(+)
MAPSDADAFPAVLEAYREQALALWRSMVDAQADEQVDTQLDARVDLQAAGQSGQAHQIVRDKRVMMDMVKQDGLALQDASDELRGDKEVVLEAVQHNGLALEHASEQLKKDQDVILKAVMNTGMAIHYIPPELFRYDVVCNRREAFLQAAQRDEELYKVRPAPARDPEPATRRFAVTEDNICVICSVRPIDVCLKLCGHVAVCSTCISELVKRSLKKRRKTQCPVCKAGFMGYERRVCLSL